MCLALKAFWSSSSVHIGQEGNYWAHGNGVTIDISHLLASNSTRTSKFFFVVSQTKKNFLCRFYIGVYYVSEITFILEKRKKYKWLSRNAVLFFANKRVPDGKMEICLLLPLSPVSSWSISMLLLAPSLIARARTVHTQTISLLQRIDLMTTSSGHNRWGCGKGTLWGKEDR